LGTGSDPRGSALLTEVVRRGLSATPQAHAADAFGSCLIDAHPGHLRALPELAASCGLREGELFGIALEDFDFDEKIVRIRRN